VGVRFVVDGREGLATLIDESLVSEILDSEVPA
jgi:hypothetical protein